MTKASSFLGIDIGTSSVKICVLNFDEEQVYKIVAQVTQAYNFKNIECRSEQDVNEILEAVQSSLVNIDKSLLGKVCSIGVCGQMHGVVLWKDKPWTYDVTSQKYTINKDCVSKLYTWEDQRCDKEFLESLPKSSEKLCTGYGCATMIWLHRFQNKYLDQFSKCGTIMDLLVAMLVDLGHPLMTTQNANNFGYFDTTKNEWETSSLDSAEFSLQILPKVVNPGTFAGVLKNNWANIPENCPILAAFGDIQCTVFACLREHPSSAVLNIGTSMQLCFETPKKCIPAAVGKSQENFEAVDFFPFFDGTFLALIPSLNGGNVLELFVSNISKLVSQMLGVEVSKDRIWEFLLKQSSNSDADASSLSVVPCLFGERFSPELRGTIQNWSPSNDFVDMFAATCKGLIDHVFQLLPFPKLLDANVKSILATGSALARNDILKSALQNYVKKQEEELNVSLPIIYINGADAHFGAAALAFRYHVQKPPKH